jgi:plastocyanin
VNSADDLAPAFAKGGGLPTEATVIFGREKQGTSFPPAEHDASFHARDRILPHAVNIAAGGTVHFVMAPFHQAAFYEDGTKPGDIEVSPATLEDLVIPGGPTLPDFIINDPNARIVTSTFSFGQTFSHTFTEPGTYLVICMVTPHFLFANMYAYVHVK